MNWTQVEGKWSDVKGRFKDKWGKLTDDDLTQIEGKQDRLLGALQQKYGYAKEKAQAEIENFMHQASGWVEQAKENVSEAVHKGKEYFQNTKVTDMAGDVRDLIGKHPLPAVMVGIGVGYLLGRLASALKS